ncbi:cystathionine beta-synthase [Basidiobolus meristosporus CBS 931.73]|uniref:Cystathionine beta-synthase n=1 Tax=Basidiobolus meristosporus CBS 931.73 TaxID=1314790 RepID=A0A1Y1YGE1_9FUNG|nr:cystathionine beta-synthase [Basidiobolus meristosporus CBS 931.73]|eukprot:ORX96704.1 cystathionine beta-synthase [Basidiobolus meristosporus CBS 931.73]
MSQNHYSAHRAGLSEIQSDWGMIKAKELIQVQNVIIIDGEASLESAVQTLIRGGVSSAPIYSQETNNFIGMFDYRDMLTYVLAVKERSSILQKESSPEIADLIKRASNAESIPVKLASDLSQRNPFYSVTEDTSLIQILDLLSSHVQRVVVADNEGKLTGILSQSLIVEYIFTRLEHYPDLKALFMKTLPELNMGKTEVISISTDRPVIDAMALLIRSGLSSVAVVDPSDRVLGNISLSDVKQYIQKNYRQAILHGTCLQFISQIRMDQGLECGADHAPIYDVPPNATLHHTVAKMLATKAHRIWVSDSNGRPVGVVSLTDVVRLLSGLQNQAE